MVVQVKAQGLLKLCELCELVDVGESQLGGMRGKLAQDIGPAGARANMKGMLLRISTAPSWRRGSAESSPLELTHRSSAVRVHVLRGTRACGPSQCSTGLGPRCGRSTQTRRPDAIGLESNG
jgi:hypothetical protein